MRRCGSVASRKIGSKTIGQSLADEYKGFFICIYWSAYSKVFGNSTAAASHVCGEIQGTRGYGAGEAIRWPHEQIRPYHICSSSSQDAAGDTRLTPKAQLPAQELGGSPLFNLFPVKGIGAPPKVDYQKHMITLSLQRPWFHLVLTWLMLIDCVPIWSRRNNHFLSSM